MLGWDRRKLHRRLGKTHPAAPPGEVIFRSSRFWDYVAPHGDTTIPSPPGMAIGDYLLTVFVIGAPGVAPVPVPPAGFLPVGGVYPLANPPDGSFDLQIYAWWWEASSTPANFTFTHASARTNLFMVDAFGADPIAPIVSGAVDPSDTPTAPSISPPVGSLILYWAQSSNFIGGIAPPAGPPVWTERYDVPASILYAATGTAVGGATGGKSVALTQAPTAAGMLAIRPA